MSGFINLREYADSHETGRVHNCSLRKVPSQASVAGQWADLSMASGNPLPQYYVGTALEATVLDGMRGIFHGADKSPAKMFISELVLMTPTAGMVGQYKLLDYLAFYPFVDMDDADPQTCSTPSALPRYADGEGVMVMAVAVTPSTGGGSFTFDYINSRGEAKTSPVQFCGTVAANIATLITSAPGTVAGQGPFLKLASGDTGVRSITSVTNLGLNGGLCALVLVRPLFDHFVYEIRTESPIQLVKDGYDLPQILDGAYLGMILNCSGSVAAGQLAGRVQFVWR